MKKLLLISFLIILFQHQTVKAQSTYFPPLSSSATWDTISPASLGWCANEIDTLYNFLQQEDTKGFIVLKDGKIVLEKYFGTFTKDSLWYWASAGKTITSFLVGKAQEENLLSISDTTSAYLGLGWTSETPAQEEKITIENQLSMTSGLDDGVADVFCTLSSCLTYLTNAGNRWAYHNAPYTLLEQVLVAATGSPINTYTQIKLKSQIGMNGAWQTVGSNNVYFSNVRSMARFGLLAQNKFSWNSNALLSDLVYINQMTNTSQSMNLSYGYLWWLNGKTSFMLPSTQTVFSGSYAPNAPSDMFAGIGKNGQIVSVSPSKGLVVVRMGEAAGNLPVPTQLVDKIWEKLNAVMCSTTSVENQFKAQKAFSIYPNPAVNSITIDVVNDSNFEIYISDVLGKVILSDQNRTTVDVSKLTGGIYYISVIQEGNYFTQKFTKE